MNALSELFLLASLITPFLGSPSFRTREASGSILEHLGGFAVPSLTVAAEHPDAEIAHSSKRLLGLVDARWRHEKCTNLAATLGIVGKWPYIDALPLNYPNRCEVISLIHTAKIEPQDGQPIFDGQREIWPQYRAASRLFLQQEMMNGVGIDELRKLVIVLRRRSNYYERNNQAWPQED